MFKVFKEEIDFGGKKITLETGSFFVVTRFALCLCINLSVV